MSETITTQDGIRDLQRQIADAKARVFDAERELRALEEALGGLMALAQAQAKVLEHKPKEP